MSRVGRTYKQHFCREADAQGYDAVQYGSGSYSELLWNIEKRQLAELVTDFGKTHSRIDYLDFASGTGRVISFLEDQVDTATGIEISQAMVDLAERKVRNAKMICTDITIEGAPIENQYDLITAFRFVLNAESPLRMSGLKCLSARLKDKTSLLIFNNHGNLFSHKVLGYPYHKIRNIGKGRQLEGNYMTYQQARRLAGQAGLVIEKTIGCGFLSIKSTRLISEDRLERLENKIAKLQVLWPFGVNQMYIARLKSNGANISGDSSEY